MERLFLFVYQYRSFFTFLFLEALSFFLLVQNNQYQGSAFFNSSNAVVANINTFSQDIRDFISLRETNRLLADENVMLKKKVEYYTQFVNQDSLYLPVDSAHINRFSFFSARVISNSVHSFKNHLTLNKGSKDGIEPGMAVINSDGVVGKVKTTSSHFSVVTSLLNIDALTSVQLKRTSHFGTIQWNTGNPRYISLLYIPRHIQPVIGDTIVTSGYNSVYPPNIAIGVIDKITLNDEALFYNLRVRLFQDFQKLTYVQVIKNNFKTEEDLLEQSIELQ